MNQFKAKFIKKSDQMKKTLVSILILLLLSITLLSGCTQVPHENTWGIYALNLETESITLLYSSPNQLQKVRLHPTDDTLVFSQLIGGESIEHEEICSIHLDGSNFTQLTDNAYMDVQPTWSTDGTEIAFVSWRDDDLDIYIMNADGSNEEKLFDSGGHDADIHWMQNTIVFTANSSIWKMNDDGSSPEKITSPPRAGEWGQANLPFGDYDPRINHQGTLIAFERLENDTSPHGNYNIYCIDINGENETRLTNNGYAQGIVAWSHTDDKIAYVVSAIDDQGFYDLYMMNADGSNNRNINPDYFPEGFLCFPPEFSRDDTTLYFIGQWWE